MSQVTGQREPVICAAGDHVWDGGDNDAVYCGVCNGYTCDVVVMWWEPEQRWISPPNYPRGPL